MYQYNFKWDKERDSLYLQHCAKSRVTCHFFQFAWGSGKYCRCLLVISLIVFRISSPGFLDVGCLIFRSLLKWSHTGREATPLLTVLHCFDWHIQCQSKVWRQSAIHMNRWVSPNFRHFVTFRNKVSKGASLELGACLCLSTPEVIVKKATNAVLLLGIKYKDMSGCWRHLHSTDWTLHYIKISQWKLCQCFCSRCISQLLQPCPCSRCAPPTRSQITHFSSCCSRIPLPHFSTKISYLFDCFLNQLFLKCTSSCSLQK